MLFVYVAGVGAYLITCYAALLRYIGSATNVHWIILIVLCPGSIRFLEGTSCRTVRIIYNDQFDLTYQDNKAVASSAGEILSV